MEVHKNGSNCLRALALCITNKYQPNKIFRWPILLHLWLILCVVITFLVLRYSYSLTQVRETPADPLKIYFLGSQEGSKAKTAREEIAF